MDRNTFRTYAAQRGYYEAALLAATMGICLANVQSWMRGV